MEYDTIDKIRSWPLVNGWHVEPGTGRRVTLGDGVTLGNWVKLGDGVTLGDECKLGNGVTLGDRVTSSDLNEIFRAHFAGPQTFWKWVTKERQSPNFDGGTQLTYEQGAVIEEPDAPISDQQCTVGLHVLRPPYRPEWLGQCEAGHDLICLRVEVLPEDICFAGLPTMDAKIRVRKLTVLD